MIGIGLFANKLNGRSTVFGCIQRKAGFLQKRNDDIPVDVYINAAKSKARVAGIPAFENNAQYDLFIMALAAMYYDNRGMTFQNPADAANAERMINSFVLELRYGDEDG